MSKKTPDVASFFSGGADELVFWSFRYFLGRRSIHTACFAQELASAAPHLTSYNRNMMVKELEEEFRHDNRARQQGDKNPPLGYDSHRAAWLKALEALRAAQKDL